jgi:DNA-binding NarL/FixJ family response regulator
MTHMSTAKHSVPPTRKRVLVVDDHPMMRRGLTQMINETQDLTVCCETGDAAQALDCVERRMPDLVLADLTMPGRNGLELLKDLHAMAPQVPVLVLSMHEEDFYAERVLRAGGKGYLMKQAGPEELLVAIRQVLRGEIYLSPAVSNRILKSLAGGKHPGQSSQVHGLTDRELDVFRLIGQGRETKQIATQLNMSVKTVETHRLNIKRKLKVSASSVLVRRAVLWVEENG